MKNIGKFIEELKRLKDKDDEIRRKRYNLLQEMRSLKKEKERIKCEIDDRINRIIILEREIREERRKRREIINKIKKLKEERRKLVKEINLCNAIIRKKPKLPKPHKDLKREIEELEIKYETSNLGKKEEKKIVNQIAKLSTLTKNYERYLQAISRKRVLVDELHDCERNIKRLYEENKALKEIINQKTNEIKKIKDEAADLQRKIREITPIYHEKVKEVDKLDYTIREIQYKKREILDILGLNSDLETEIIIKMLERHNSIIKKAIEKLVKGEKLTFEEFSILVKYGIVDKETAIPYSKN